MKPHTVDSRPAGTRFLLLLALAPAVPAGITWRATPNLDFSVSGRNLLHAHHPEQDFASSATGMPSETQRSAFARLAWRF